MIRDEVQIWDNLEDLSQKLCEQTEKLEEAIAEELDLRMICAIAKTVAEIAILVCSFINEIEPKTCPQ